jgi:hypothetical protein
MSPTKSKSKKRKSGDDEDYAGGNDVEEEKRGKKRRAMDAGILAKAHKYMTTYPELDQGQGEGPITETKPGKKRKPRKGKQPKPLPAVEVGSRKKGKAIAITEEDDDEEEEESNKKSSKKSKKNKKKKKKKSKALTPLEKNPEKEKRHIYECLDFLRKWESNRSEWKIEKLKQVWLLKNILNQELITEPDFQILLSYMGSVQGHARRVTLKEMEIFMQAYDGKYLGTGSQADKAPEELTAQYNRAREIVQTLSDE